MISLQCALLEFQKNIIFTDNCWQTWENASELDVILAGFHHLLIAINLLIREACWIWHPLFAESELENCWLPLKINYCGCWGGLFKFSETNVLSTNSTPSKNIKRKEWKEQSERQPALRLRDRWKVKITSNLISFAKQHFSYFKNTALTAPSPLETAEEHVSLLASVRSSFDSACSHSVWRACMGALLRELVNTKVLQFTCHIIGGTLTRARHAAYVCCVYE